MIDSDERWLTGPEAEAYLADAAAAEVDELAQLARLRKVLSAQRARLIVEQATLRRRARTKFTHAAKMFFTAVGLEQATDEVTAAYKATRFAAGARVCDFCCGIGGDLLAIGSRCSGVGFDRDAVTAARAAANCRVMHNLADNGFRAVVETAAVAPAHAADCEAWHIDPDRRPAGRRTTHVELHEPPLDVLDAMLVANHNAAVKLAPAAELPDTWRDSAEAEWFSRRGECKQLVAWFGGLTHAPGLRRATAVADDGTATSVEGRGDEPTPHVARAGRFLFEPDAAVLAAGLVGALAEQYQIAAVHPGSVYLTGDEPHTSPLLAAFEIVDTLPFDRRKLRAYLATRGIGGLEIKKRGVDVDVDRLRRELQVAGEASASLILLRRGDRVTAVITRRLNDER